MSRFDIHIHLARHECAPNKPVTCCECGTIGTGYIADGWDMIGDDGGTFDICWRCQQDIFAVQQTTLEVQEW
jgi:hypothetical protein